MAKSCNEQSKSLIIKIFSWVSAILVVLSDELLLLHQNKWYGMAITTALFRGLVTSTLILRRLTRADQVGGSSLVCNPISFFLLLFWCVFGFKLSNCCFILLLCNFFGLINMHSNALVVSRFHWVIWTFENCEQKNDFRALFEAFS